jgi:hypothetical protein
MDQSKQGELNRGQMLRDSWGWGEGEGGREGGSHNPHAVECLCVDARL